ncbi:MAG: VWA domain-containing protein [Desulfurococcales archaeon]|nr:VWA domain-containing protein [Desulfurococcales archaeon]
MDVVFVVDGTGSMVDAIDNVKSGINDVIGAVNAASGGDYRIVLVTFEDVVYVNATFDVNENDIIDMINNLTAIGRVVGLGHLIKH